jgi:hypothetical protein
VLFDCQPVEAVGSLGLRLIYRFMNYLLNDATF